MVKRGQSGHKGSKGSKGVKVVKRGPKGRKGSKWSKEPSHSFAVRLVEMSAEAHAGGARVRINRAESRKRGKWQNRRNDGKGRNAPKTGEMTHRPDAERPGVNWSNAKRSNARWSNEAEIGQKRPTRKRSNGTETGSVRAREAFKRGRRLSKQWSKVAKSGQNGHAPVRAVGDVPVGMQHLRRENGREGERMDGRR